MISVNTNNWMSALNDNLTLDSLSIPGTHDSGTRGAPKGGARTQNFGIYEQLNDGVRFLDIRVKANGSAKDPLNIYHGEFSCDVSLGNVLNDCLRFFQENPNETIIMLMNSATSNGSSKIQSNFNVYCSQTEYKSLFYLGDTLPNLGQARGKIIIFRRFLGNVGIDLSEGWLTNQTFTLVTPQNQTFKIEDQYKEHDTREKMSAVESLINDAIENPNNGVMYITYNSISLGGHTPYQYAWGGGIGKVNPKMNPGLSEFLQKKPAKQYIGTIMLDFYNNESNSIDNSNVELIINANNGISLN